MKFVVFNIVVAAALVYLVANRDSGLDISLPGLGEVKAAADRVLEPKPAPAPQAENPFSVVPEADHAAALDVTPEKPLFDAPVIDREDLPSATSQVAAADKSAAEAPQPLAPDVARRRAEVLGEPSATPATPTVPEPAVEPVADRRRQLLDLAEEMEYLAADLSVQ